MNIIVSNSREINAAVPVTVFILVSLSLYGLYDVVSGEDESSTLDLIDPVWDYTHKTITNHYIIPVSYSDHASKRWVDQSTAYSITYYTCNWERTCYTKA